LVRHEASVGYSTCFWHNVLHSVRLYDRDGWYHELQAAARRPYPEPLKHAILAKNHPILRQSLSSYLSQIERAVDRGDGVSVQHRVTAVLASYFDILFAVNELPHPGEKRLLPFALTRCAKRPRCMEDRVRSLLGVPAMPTTPAVISAVSGLLDDLDALLEAEQMLAPAVSDVRDTGGPIRMKRPRRRGRPRLVAVKPCSQPGGYRVHIVHIRPDPGTGGRSGRRPGGAALGADPPSARSVRQGDGTPATRRASAPPPTDAAPAAQMSRSLGEQCVA
jgi:hypothetical protein